MQIEVPAKVAVPCEGCYPACDMSETYTAVVPKKHEKAARQVLKELEREVAESPLDVAPDAQAVVLIAASGCTRKACPEDDPCCNTCTFQSWRKKDAQQFRAYAAEGELPTCEVDGCGECEFTLVGTGHHTKRYFVVHRFTKSAR